MFDTQFPVCEDYDLWLRICAKYPIILIEEPQIKKYGGHADQLSQKQPNCPIVYRTVRDTQEDEEKTIKD